MELGEPPHAGWCLARHADELLSLLPISMMQASPRAQGQEKGLILSDTKATGLQGELEPASKKWGNAAEELLRS